MNSLNYMRPKDRSEVNLLRTTLLVAVVLAALLIAARRTGAFAEAIELPLYDKITQLVWPWTTGHDDIVLVTHQQEFDWESGHLSFRGRLDDAPLAEILHKIAEGQPSTIALDLLRPEDKPGPNPDGPLRLRAVVEDNPNIIWGFALPTAENPGGTALPPCLSHLGEALYYRSGIANFPEDGRSNKMIRRGYFAVLGGAHFSLAGAAARHHAVEQLGLDEGELYTRAERLFSLAPDAGGYALEDSGGNQFLLKYGRDLDARFEQYNHAIRTVLDMSLAERTAAFKDKIVFFGTMPGVGAQDEKPGIGNPKLRGVKLQALVTGQMLRELTAGEQPVLTLPNTFEDLLIIFSGVLTVLIFLRWPSLGSWKSVLVVGLLLALNLGIAIAFLKAGYWVPMGAPMLITAGAGFTSIALLFAHMRSEATKAYLLLERKVGPELARVIWTNRTRILGNQKVSTEPFTGTIFFSDLAGYTPASKKIEELAGPGAFADWIGTYMQKMIALVTDHDGFVKDFEGDAIMAVFGFPADGSDTHATNAVRCARAMEDQFRQLNAKLPPEFPRYRTRIGIYTGEVKAEHLTADLMFEFTFTGFAVNKAKRLETFEKGLVDWTDRHARILISTETQELMNPEIPAHRRPEPCKIDPNVPAEEIWEVSNKT